MKEILLVFVLTLTVIQSNAARILAVFPAPSISHQVVFRPLTQALAQRGHEVVVLTPDPAFPKGETPPNLTEIDLHDISYGIVKKNFVNLATGRKNELVDQLKAMSTLLMILLQEQSQVEEVQRILNGSEHFDLLLIEAIARTALGFSHKFKTPIIQVSSFGAMYGNYEAMGAPTHPILYPAFARQRLYNLTFWEKLNELYNHYHFIKIFEDAAAEETRAMRKIFGDDMPSVEELTNNVDMLFLNMHPIFEGNHPVPPGVIHTWGTHVKSDVNLPEDLKSYLDSSKHGVIYVSFGTNVDPADLPPSTIQMFVKVLSQLPYNVIWKWNQDTLPGQSENIKFGKWFPQSSLLKHPNIKLFITQGGLQSTDEAILAGVPLVGIPMMGDQWFNAEKYVYLKIGVKLDVETINEDQFRNAIQTVIGDESYRKNIKDLGAMMRDQPEPPLERAVWWTEYVIRHKGAKHLRSPAANITWTQYLELEFVFILLSSLFVLLATVLGCVYSLYKYFSATYFPNSKFKKS